MGSHTWASKRGHAVWATAKQVHSAPVTTHNPEAGTEKGGDGGHMAQQNPSCCGALILP